MTLEELQSVVRNGEDSTHQFKEKISNALSLASEMVAFSNGRGGHLYIGVSDSGNLPGISTADVQKYNQIISNAASQLVHSPIMVSTVNVPVESDRLVIVIDIPEGLDKPYFDNNGVIWMKCGADKRRVHSKEELRRIFQATDQFHADALPTKATMDRLDQSKLRSFYQNIYRLPLPVSFQELKKTLRVLDVLSDDDTLNLAGVLLFSDNPQGIRPYCMIKAVRYPGVMVHPTTYADYQDIGGTLEDQFAAAKAFIMRNLHWIPSREGANSPSMPEIPSEVFEELLVNAVVHRDYLVSAPIRIFIYDDRIEIISPGHLPNHLTVEKIIAGSTNLRNPILSSFAARGVLPYRGLGSGISRSLSLWPHIRFRDDREGLQFSAIVYREPVDMETAGEPGIPYVSRELPSPDKNKINHRKLTVMEQLSRNPSMTVDELSQFLGMSRRATLYVLDSLKKEGLILRKGPAHGGYWEVQDFRSSYAQI